jgi:hypothetical protein
LKNLTKFEEVETVKYKRTSLENNEKKITVYLPYKFRQNNRRTVRLTKNHWVSNDLQYVLSLHVPYLRISFFLSRMNLCAHHILLTGKSDLRHKKKYWRVIKSRSIVHFSFRPESPIEKQNSFNLCCQFLPQTRNESRNDLHVSGQNKQMDICCTSREIQAAYCCLLPYSHGISVGRSFMISASCRPSMLISIGCDSICDKGVGFLKLLFSWKMTLSKNGIDIQCCSGEGTSLSVCLFSIPEKNHLYTEIKQHWRQRTEGNSKDYG